VLGGRGLGLRCHLGVVLDPNDGAVTQDGPEPGRLLAPG